MHTDTYPSRTHHRASEGDFPVPEGDPHPIGQHQASQDRHHVGACLHHITQPYHPYRG